MIEIVQRVRELTATAVAALPRVGELDSLTDAAATALLGELAGLRRHVEASIALLAADIDRKSARELGGASLARRAGAKSGAELVQKLTGATRGDAIKAVRVGALLEVAHAIAPLPPLEAPGADGGGTGGAPAAAPVLAAPAARSLDELRALPGNWDAPAAVAVRNGWLTADQGDRLTAGLGQPPGADRGKATPDARTDARWRQAVLDLIADCWDGEQTPEEVGRAAKTMRACLDRAWAAENAERLYERRSLKRVPRTDGMVAYHLLVDPLTDHEVWAPLYRSLAPRLGGPRFLTDDERQRAAELERDDRSNEQLLADTLVSAITTGLAAITAGGRTGTPGTGPAVTIAVTTAELTKAIGAEKRLRDHAGDRTHCPTAQPHDSRPAPDPTIAWTAGSTQPVTGAQLLAAVCDGTLGAILFDDTGQALDVTKHERTFSTRQRQAMALRDGGCLHPGCATPPAACEAHHVRPWAEHPANRRTETRDGVLLCRFHDLNLHNHGAHITRENSAYWLHWPARDPVKLLPTHGITAQLRAEALP